MNWLLVSTIFCICASSILVLIYGATLVQVLLGSRYKFVIKLLVMILFCNVFIILINWSYFVMRDDYSMLPWFSLLAVSTIGRDICFNISHWIFAFEYFSIARFMPYVIKGELYPER